MPTVVEADPITAAKVNDRIRFAEESRAYTVQARGDRYLVCTKPFALKNTVLYTIVDLVVRVRGTENLVLGMGAETREQCERMLARLEGRNPHYDGATEVSRRNRITLDVVAVLPPIPA